MDRRQFLGAAAALAGLGHGDGDDQRDGLVDDELREVLDRGDSSVATAPWLDGVWSSVELYGATDEDSSVMVTGYRYDDEPSQVELKVSTEVAMLTVSVGPDRAREIAADLERAAGHAESGFDDVGADE